MARIAAAAAKRRELRTMNQREGLSMRRTSSPSRRMWPVMSGARGGREGRGAVGVDGGGGALGAVVGGGEFPARVGAVGRCRGGFGKVFDGGGHGCLDSGR